MHHTQSGFQNLILMIDKIRSIQKAHKGAHANNDLYIGHPEFEGFNAII